MYSDLIISFAGIVIFVAGAARFGWAAYHSRHATLPFQSKFGIRHQRVRQSEKLWAQAHSSVWPLFALGAAVCVFHTVALLFAPFIEGISLRSYNAVIILSGGVVLCAVSVLAEKAGIAAVEE